MGDISKKTLAVLFIVAIVLSAVATWKMLSAPSKIVVSNPENQKGTSQVSFGIGMEEVPAKPVQSAGQVIFEVK